MRHISKIQGKKSWWLIIYCISSFKLQSTVEVDILEQPKEGNFSAICHDGPEKLLTIQADLLGLKATERYQLHSWRASLQELSLKLSLLLLLLLLFIIITIIIFCVTVSCLIFVGIYLFLVPCWEIKTVNFCFNSCHMQRTCSRKQIWRKRSFCCKCKASLKISILLLLFH